MARVVAWFALKFCIAPGGIAQIGNRRAAGVGTDFISHSYYGSSPKVLADLHPVFCSSYAPSKRMPPLSSHSTVYGHDHWSFLGVVIQEE